MAAGITNPSAQAASLATEKKSDSPKLAQKSPAAALVVDSIKAIRPSPALAAGNNIAADTRTETALSAVKKHSTAAATPQAASGTAAGAAAHVPACEGSRQTGPAAGTHKHATSPADACRDVVNAAAQTTAPAQPGNTTPAQAPASIAAPAQPQQACQIIAALQDKLALPEQQVADVTGSAAEELVGLRTRYRVHRYVSPPLLPPC